MLDEAVQNSRPVITSGERTTTTRPADRRAAPTPFRSPTPEHVPRPTAVSDQSLEREFGADGVPFARWLLAQGVDVLARVAAASAELRRHGRHPKAEQRLAYRRKVLLGIFLVEWLKRRRRDGAADADSPDLFELAVFLLLTKKSFEKRISEFVSPHIDTGTVALRDGEAFVAFCTESVSALASQMASKFDVTRDAASRGAIAYLEKLAVSQFLKKLLLSRDRFVTGGVLSYLASKDTRLSDRMRIAYKLVYVPMALNGKESTWLKKRHGFDTVHPFIPTCMQVKAAASVLGFTGGPDLSRRLYQVRKWADSWMKGCKQRHAGLRPE
jgi:hypothetical protein